jgi:formate hydrogenlyase transcriptional activator
MVPLCIPNSAEDWRRHHALLEIAERVSSSSQPGEVLRNFVSGLSSVVPLDFVNFALYDPARRIMKMHAWEGAEWPPREPIEIPMEDTAVGAVWRNQTVLALDDLSTAQQFAPERQWLSSQQIRSYCVLPLTTSHERLGAFGFGSKRAYAFTLPDIQFLRRVAEIAALCIDRTQPESVLVEETARLRLLLEVCIAQNQATDLRDPVAAILGSIQKWAARDNVGIYLFDEISQALRLYMTDVEIAEKMAPDGLVPLDGTLAGQVFRSQRGVVFDRAGLEELPFASVKRGIELGVKSLYLAPLRSAKGSLGVLKVARREDQPFASRDLELLEQVAVAISPLLERARVASPGKNVENGVESDVRNDAEKDVETSPLAFPGALVSDASPVVVERLSEVKASSVFTTAHAGIPAWFGDPADLAESEEVLTAYFNAPKVGLCVLDHDLRYLAINQTLAELHGMTPKEHLGKSIREVLGDLAELVEPYFRRVLTEGQPILKREITAQLPSQKAPGHWIEHFIPIKGTDGKVKQIGIVLVEITEQKRVEESLRNVSQELREEQKRQQVLSEVSRVLAGKWDARQIFPKISSYLRRVLRQEYASLAVHDEKTGLPVRQAVDFPLAKNSHAGEQISTVKVPKNRVSQKHSPLIFTRDEVEGLDPGIADTLSAEGLKSLCCVPLLRPKGPLGVLVLGSTRANAFKTDDLTLLSQVAAQLAIALENARAAREVEELRNRLSREKSYLEGEIRSHPEFNKIIGESAALKQVLEEVVVVAESDATVLLLGETGTGKGMIARAIHSVSKRTNKNFVVLNCAAIPTGLLESELFGHEKGAFTGAVNQKIGRLEQAHEGTLFLDEIGEILLELQPKLLRVLQDSEFERLGGTKTIKVDLRLIAATNRDIVKSIAEKEFRSDLFYRLNVFPIRLPPLRDRREDIPVLVRHFVRKYAATMNRVIETIPTETMDALINWSWPGNIRELENFVERSVILTEGTALRAPLAELQGQSPAAESLENSEREHILRVLRETKGTISGPAGAARRLGIKRTTLQSKMQRLKITRHEYSDRTPE